MKISQTDEKIAEVVKSNYSIAGCLRDLGLIAAGGNYRTLHRKIKELNLDTSHFTGKGWNTGERSKVCNPPKALKEILKERSPYSSWKLAKRLIKEGYKSHKCESCNNTEWLGQPIKLELHHINGDHDDNRLENLQLLCPNCHAYTDNFRGKNQKRNKSKSAQEETPGVESSKFGESLPGNAGVNAEPSPSNREGVETRRKKPKASKPKEPKFCAFCGEELRNTKYKYCSQECAHAAVSKRPPMLELLEKFKELKSYLQVGKYYGVSDTAVRKWVRLYKIEDMVKA